MDIMERLAQRLDEEAKPKEQNTETPQMTQELYEALLEKKMNDMELRLNATINKLIAEKTTKTEPTETVEQKGETNDSSTELSTSE